MKFLYLLFAILFSSLVTFPVYAGYESLVEGLTIKYKLYDFTIKTEDDRLREEFEKSNYENPGKYGEYSFRDIQ